MLLGDPGDGTVGIAGDPGAGAGGVAGDLGHGAGGVAGDRGDGADGMAGDPSDGAGGVVGDPGDGASGVRVLEDDPVCGERLSCSSSNVDWDVSACSSVTGDGRVQKNESSRARLKSASSSVLYSLWYKKTKKWINKRNVIAW